MPIRHIIRIDEEKCDGCGLCATACAEGAIAIVDGKARLISETYCDGLGACLDDCPRGAITLEEREAAPFDEEAVKHAQAMRASLGILPCGCPGSHVRTLTPRGGVDERGDRAKDRPSRLGNWPVQLRLVPVSASYLLGADLVIAADCVPCAYPSFHDQFLPGRVLIVGCPKLDDAGYYRRKLAEVFSQNRIRSVEVVYMEVPCCGSLVHLVLGALADAKVDIPVRLTRMAIRGIILASQEVKPPGSAMVVPGGI